MRGAIVSLDRSDPRGSWRWGGEDWTGGIGAAAPGRLAGMTLAVPDPTATAARWGEVLGRGRPPAREPNCSSTEPACASSARARMPRRASASSCWSSSGNCPGGAVRRDRRRADHPGRRGRVAEVPEPIDALSAMKPLAGVGGLPRGYVLMDVFTDTPLQGNPLAVFTDARGMPAADAADRPRAEHLRDGLRAPRRAGRGHAGADLHARERAAVRRPSRARRRRAVRSALGREE